MLFKPYANECTSFRNVRLLKFEKAALEVSVSEPVEGIKTVYKNDKPVKILFNTNSMKVMNTLQKMHLISADKAKLKCSLEDLVEWSNIEELLQKWSVTGHLSN